MLPEGYSKEEFLKPLLAQPWLAQRGPKVNLTRWRTWLGSHFFRRDFRGEKLLTLLFYGIQAGWLKRKSNFGAMMDSLHASKTTAAFQTKVTTKASKQELAKMRDRCKNTMHLAACVLADEKVEFDSVLIIFTGSIIRAEHGVLANSLKNTVAALVIDADRAWLRDRSLLALCDLLCPWKRPFECERVGVRMEFDAGELRGIDKDDPMPIQQDMIAASLLKWLFVELGRCSTPP